MRRAIAFALLVSPFACATFEPATPLPPGDPLPGALVAALSERSAARHALRGVARVSVDAEDGGVRLRGRQVVVVERPARLRVEIQGFLGQTVALLVTDGERFSFVNAEERTVESGPVHPGLLWEVAYLALEPHEVVDLLLGTPPLESGLSISGSSRSRDGDVHVELADGSGAPRRRLTFDPDGRVRRAEDLDARGRLASDARFDDYGEVGGESFAHAITLDLAAGSTHAELSLEDVQLNPDLPAGVFRFGGDAAGEDFGSAP